MESTHIQKFIHTSPRKLRLIADMVRNIEPVRALDILRVTSKDAAFDLRKAIETALANSKQKGLDSKKIFFKSIEINESAKMRRYRAGTRGRVKPFKRRMAHIKIILSDDQVQSSKFKVQNEKIKEKGGMQTKVVMDNSADSAK